MQRDRVPWIVLTASGPIAAIVDKNRDLRHGRTPLQAD